MAMRGCSILSFFLIGAIVVGCTKNKPNDQTLRIHFPLVKINLDPQRMEDAYSMAIATQLYRGLLRYNTTGDIRADLAESWTESSDHRSYRFKLKKATFSDGSPITAKHVQMTFARLFRLGASMAADIDYIAGAREFKSKPDIAKFGIQPIGDDVVEFRLAEPSAIFLKQLAVADCAILPILDFRNDPVISAKGVFSGPFKITSDLNENQITLEKWRSDPMDSARPPQKVHYSLQPGEPVQLASASEIDTLDHYRVLQVFDPDERAMRYKQIQKQILKHYTIIPMFFGSEASGLWSAKVKSVPSHPLGIHTLPLESVEMSAE